MASGVRGPAVLAAFALLLAGCGETASSDSADAEDVQTSADGDGEDPADEQLLIGYAPGTYDFTDFFGQLLSGVEMELQDRGVDYEISIAAAESYRQDQQLANVENLINLGVDYIIAGPTLPEVQLPAYQQANEAGIPLLMAQFVTPLEGADFLQYSGVSHENAGQIAGDYICEYLNDGDSVAILSGEAGSPVDIGRVEHALPILEDCGVEVVAREHANFERELAFRKTEEILAAHPDVDFIYGGSSAMALGAMSAVEAHGSDIPVIGVGGVLEELEMVAAGRLHGTILRDPAQMGRTLGEAIYLHSEGREDEIEHIVEISHVMVASCEDVLEHGIPELFEAADKQWPPDC